MLFAYLGREFGIQSELLGRVSGCVCEGHALRWSFSVDMQCPLLL